MKVFIGDLLWWLKFYYICNVIREIIGLFIVILRCLFFENIILIIEVFVRIILFNL